MSTRCFVLACCLLVVPLSAQDRPGASGKSSSHSTSHRVVVVDGKTVVDERKVDGKTVDSGKDLAHGLPQEWRDLLDRVRRGADLGAGKTGDSAQASSSHTRRVVVENGRVVVDEETRDGKPVRHGGGGQQSAPARADAHADAHAESHAWSSSEHSESSDSSHSESSRSDRRSDKSDKKGNSAGNKDSRQRDDARDPKGKPAPAEPAPKDGKPAPSVNDRNA